MYAPLGFFITFGFTIINMLQIPVAYVNHVIVLIQTITNSDETMDELSEKLKRVVTIFKFIIFGPFFLILSIPINSFVFYYNLYTKSIYDS